MKTFVRELREQWAVARFTLRPHSHYFKYKIKEAIKALNEELISLVRLFNFHPYYLLVVAVAVVVSIAVPSWMPYEALLSLLSGIAGALFTFISLLIAVAIFISSLSMQIVRKMVDEEGRLMRAFKESGGALKSYVALWQEADLSDNEKLEFVKAVAAETVYDQESYESFKAWYEQYVNQIDFSAVYEKTYKYPYDLSVAAVEQRMNSVYRGILICRRIADTITTPHYNYLTDTLEQPVNKLLSAIDRYNDSGNSGFYAQRSFIGRSLLRIVLLSAASVLSVGLFYIAPYWNGDLFRRIDWDLVGVTGSFALLLSVLTSLIVGKYVLDFVQYLKHNGAYRTSKLSVINFYEKNKEGVSSSLGYMAHFDGR